MKQVDAMLTLCPLVKNVKSFIKSHTSLNWLVWDFFCVFKIISWYIIVEKAKHQKRTNIKLICALPRFVNKISLFLEKGLIPMVCYVLPMMI